MFSLKRFLKDSIIYGIAAVLPRVINFLMVRVHTDALPAETYAENTDFYIWAALFSIVLTLGFETTFFRYYKEKELRNDLVGTSMFTLIGWVGLFIIGFVLFFPWIQNNLGFGAHPLRLKVFIGIMALDTLALVPFAYLRASGRPVKYTTIKLINVGIIVLIQLIALRWIPQAMEHGKHLPEVITHTFTSLPKVDYIFVSNLLSSAVSLLLVLPFLFRFKWQWNTALWRKMLRYSYPIVIAGLAYAINENLDKWLIGSLIDKETEGLYAAAYKLAIFMNLYIMAFRLGAEPLFFNISNDKNAPKNYARIMTYFVMVGSLALVGIALFMDIFKHFVNPTYWEALAIVPVVLLANLFLGMYHNLSIWYKLIDKTKFGMYFSIVGAVLTIAVNVIFLPKYGYMVAAYATLIAYGTMMTLSYLVGKTRYPIPYDLKQIALFIVVSVSISYVAFYKVKPNLYTSGLIFLLYMIFIGFYGYRLWQKEKS
ncbi:MAG: polysaccharide biosynthesis protein [Flavobacteriia bacterium]|nr:MAG: polysaccharide biosynthesis protein [Flavobacteriia bacterium]